MATTNYSIEQWGEDGIPTSTWGNRLGSILSGVLRNSLVGGGVLSGWTISLDGTVAAGEGLVGGCVPKTTEAQAITDLTSDSLNYVYATVDADSPSDTRSVVFTGSVSSTIPAGAVRLGTITLDAAGDATAKDDNPTGWRRDLWRGGSRRRKVAGSTSQVVTVGTTKVFEVDFSADEEFADDGMVGVRITSEDTSVYAIGQITGSGTMDLHITNNWTVGDAYDYYEYDPDYVEIEYEIIGEV